MEPKRKIVIPLGDASGEAVPASNYDGGVTVPAPLFDEEATMGARPVVLLAGVAGGFAIGVYKSRQNRTTAATTTNPAATTASTDASAQAPAEQLPVIASKQSSEPRARTTEAGNAPTERNVRDNKSAKDDEQIIPPVEVRERGRETREAKRERDDKIKDDGEQQRVSKRQKKEQRRRARDNDERDADLNQQIERAGREVNRIRDIFEGQRP
jgi:hypothetical protein